MPAPVLSILLVDDDAVDRQATRRLLSRSGLEVVVREVDSRALVLPALTEAPVDCVLLDHRLGVDDGLEVLSDLRLRSISVPVIMLTGQGDDQLAAAALQAGAADYLEKGGLGATRLRSTILNVMSYRRQVDEARRYHHALRILAEGTAASIGEDYFPALLHHLGLAFNARHAWIAAPLPESDQAQTRAYWASSGDHRHTWHYALPGSLCVETLMREGVHLHPQAQITLREGEETRVVEGRYVAMSLRPENARPLGVLVMVGCPDDIEQRGVATVLSIVAQRAAGELLRLRHEQRAADTFAAQSPGANLFTMLRTLYLNAQPTQTLTLALAALREQLAVDRVLVQHWTLREEVPWLSLAGHATAPALSGRVFINAEPLPLLPGLEHWQAALHQGEALGLDGSGSPDEARLLRAEGVVRASVLPLRQGSQLLGCLRLDALRPATVLPDPHSASLVEAQTLLAHFLSRACSG